MDPSKTQQPRRLGSDSPLLCAKCGYALRTAPIDGDCTECGTPIRKSLPPAISRWGPNQFRKAPGVFYGINGVLRACVLLILGSAALAILLRIVWQVLLERREA